MEAEACERVTQMGDLQSRYTAAVAGCREAAGIEANAARQREQALRREAQAAIGAALTRVSELEREAEEMKTTAVSEEQVGTEPSPQNTDPFAHVIPRNCDSGLEGGGCLVGCGRRRLRTKGWGKGLAQRQWACVSPACVHAQ